MSQAAIQASFNSGEWSPTLNARVDMAKYRSGAALLENFFVDYRGGASTRPGTRYVLQAYKSETPVRLVTFQGSFVVSYVLELGDFYMRFYFDGAPVLETAFNISAATQANPCVITVTGNNYVIDDWIYITGVAGMTQLNGKYYKVLNVSGASVTLGAILDGANINSTGYTAYTSGGTASRVYTIATPWAAEDLELLKFAGDVNVMRFVHPDYPPYILTLISATNWSLQPIQFGSTISTPTGVAVTTTLSSSTVNYSYTVTAIDINGQESVAAVPGALANVQDIRTTSGSNTITWNAVSGAVSYNIYKAMLRYGSAVPAGAQHGFVGNSTGTTFIDSNIAQDFSITPPLIRNPFQGAGVQSVTVTNAGTYTTVPSATLSNAPSGGVTGIVQPSLGVTSVSVGSSENGWAIGDLMTVRGTNKYGGIILRVLTLSGSQVASVAIVSPGAIISGSTPSNPIVFEKTSATSLDCSLNLTWGVTSVNVLSSGAGYVSTPTVTFSAGSAAATAVLAPAAAGNPSTIGVYQQRQVYGGADQAPLQFNMSQPGSPNNFNVSNPLQPTDAIHGHLVSQILNTIKAFVQMPSGLVTLTDRAAWLINAGSANEAVTQVNITANSHSYNGISDVPPILANFDILYVQAKGSSVRNLSYNFYANVFTGTDITVQSSHLFFNYTIKEWAWAEEPFKVAWAVRNDGVLLSLTFLKEQEFIAWAHSITDGEFKSVANVTQTTEAGEIIDTVYHCIEREIASNTVQYIEIFTQRSYPDGVINAWCVDAGLGYEGTPATSFSGGEHLAGKTVVGLADGVEITPFVMPESGNFTLPTAASKVVVGLPFTCDLKTLAIDLGEPTVQGKVKQIPYVDIRVADTLGLKIGADFDSLVPMKDLIIGNVSSTLIGQASQIVDDLVTGDARTFLNATFTVPGQYCIRQDKPFPATILGVIPQIAVGDTTGGSGGRRSA